MRCFLSPVRVSSLRRVQFRLLTAGATLLVMSGCFAQLKQRAARELKCPEEAIAVEDVGFEVAVHGCGARSTYVWTDYAGWLRNSDVQQVESRAVE